MKKKKAGCLSLTGCLSIFVLAVFVLLLLVVNTNLFKNLPFDTEPVVLKRLSEYQPMVEDELNKHELKQYTALVLGMMYQESKGKGTDPMQASESLGLGRNEIKDADASIKQGIKQFSKNYNTGKEKGVDLDTIIQSYNMGPGYIDYIAKNGGKHSENLAKQFSEIQVNANPELYNCGGNKSNFRYPYCYGDFSYSEKVNQKADTVEEKLNLDESLTNEITLEE
ncbi:lysozyme family protein [Bacillus gobiensis]|uniref:lysozyme family protein n=1 Tax=Bacillus gobiensis TaxID=1441095 RepID=UPI003D1BF141